MRVGERIDARTSAHCALLTDRSFAFSFAFSFFSFLSAKGKTREVKLDEDFFTGYRKTIVEPSEVLVNILIPFAEEVIQKGKLLSDM